MAATAGSREGDPKGVHSRNNRDVGYHRSFTAASGVVAILRNTFILSMPGVAAGSARFQFAYERYFHTVNFR
jgi:hypothetical protein